MSIQVPKWKSYTLTSYEIPHIYRDPPKAVYTTKRDKVSEVDVQWMYRPDSEYGDPTRINENIKYLPRGIDPIAKVKYGSNPYKLKVIRIPERSAETEVALSRPRLHQNKSVNTNPGLRDGVSGIDINQKIDLYNIKRITDVEKTPHQAKPGNYYKIDYLDPNIFDIQPTSKNIRDDPLFYSAQTNKLIRIEQPEGNREYLSDKLTDKIKQFNVPALKAMTIQQTVVPDLKLISKYDLQTIMSSQAVKFNGPMTNFSDPIQLAPKSQQYTVTAVPTLQNSVTTQSLDYELPSKQTFIDTISNLKAPYMKALEHWNYDVPLMPKRDMYNVCPNASAQFKKAMDNSFEYNLFSKSHQIEANASKSKPYTQNGENAPVELDRKINIDSISNERSINGISGLNRNMEAQLKNAEKYMPKLELAMYQHVNEYTP